MNENQQLCILTVDVQLQPNGKYDVYLSTEGSSGCHYKDQTDEDIAANVRDMIQCYAEAMEQEE